MNQTRVDGVIEGLADFLFNRMVDPSVLDSGQSGSVMTKDQRVQEGLAKVYRNADGILYLPGWNFKRMLIEGAHKSNIKLAKKKLRDLIAAGVFPDNELTFGIRDADYLHEVPGKIPPRRGAAAIIRRPALRPGWRLVFGLNFVLNVEPDAVKAALTIAGLEVGLGSWRPQYGRFLVREWTVTGLASTDDLSEPSITTTKRSLAEPSLAKRSEA